MTPGWEFGRIAWKRDSGKVVFSSEPLDGGRWNKMSDLEIAEAAPNGTGLTLKFKSILRRGQGSSK